MQHIQRRRSVQPLVRAVSVIMSVVVMVTGVTYAALQSQQAKITGNSIHSATAGLTIGLTSTLGTFGSTQTGFSFDGIIPGGPAVPANGNTFFLNNTGATTLNLKAAMSTTPTNAANVNLDKVYVVLTRVGVTPAVNQKISLASLMSSYATGGVQLNDTLFSGVIAQYRFQVQMDADAFTATSADIGNIDLVFSGNAVTQ